MIALKRTTGARMYAGRCPLSRRCIAIMRNAVYDGADAFYIHLDHLDPAAEACDLRRYSITRALNRSCCIGKSAYIPMMSSRGAVYGRGGGRVDGDVMGDIFDASPRQLSLKPDRRQAEKLIDKIPRVGAKC